MAIAIGYITLWSVLMENRPWYVHVPCHENRPLNRPWYVHVPRTDQNRPRYVHVS